MYCPRCQNQLPEGARFCSACGADVEAFIPKKPQAPAAVVDPQEATTRPESKKTSGKRGAVIAAVAAAVLCIGGGAVWFVLSQGGSGDDSSQRPAVRKKEPEDTPSEDDTEADSPAASEGEGVDADISSYDESKPPAEENDKPYKEYYIDSLNEVDVGFLHLIAGYSKPIEVAGSYDDVSVYDAYLRLDVYALDNYVGFPTGDWVPYLTIDYEITDGSGSSEATGTLLPMSDDDGPHYGANIVLPEGDHILRFIIHSPEEQGYVLHLDDYTGPGGSFDDYFGSVPMEVSGEWSFKGL